MQHEVEGYTPMRTIFLNNMNSVAKFMCLMLLSSWPLAYSQPSEHFTNLANIDCGLPSYYSSSPKSPRIIGGRTTEIGEFPWVVSLQTPEGKHFCGGVILNRNHILTAAHCFISYIYGAMDASDLRKLRVIAGSHDLLRSSNNEDTQSIVIGDVTWHPRFSHFYPEFRNDLAIIRLDGNLTWGWNVKPACIPGKVRGLLRDTSLGTVTSDTVTSGIVAGWGTTTTTTTSHNNNEPSTLLRKITLPLITSKEECQNAYRKSGIYWVARDSHICAKAEGEDTSYGDSGSGLFTLLGDRAILRGIVSGGEHNLPGIYTRVGYFTKWIRDNM